MKLYTGQHDIKETEAIYSLWENSKRRRKVKCRREMAVVAQTKQWDSEWRVGRVLGQMTLERKMFNKVISGLGINELNVKLYGT